MNSKKQHITEAKTGPEIANEVRKSHGTDVVVHTTLRTNERVIARVTDGIYRQPASALRELISNSYDADATRVAIKTDAPRFDRIVVEDDGHGMSPEILAHLLVNIGGSAKRHPTGMDLGITSDKDLLLSPNGRRLIGKIGIGLFSISQLTQSFQIITKIKGDDYRTVATVSLRQYADTAFHQDEEGNEEFESGQVHIWREKAVDIEAHGTTIVLTNIRPQARDTLQSNDIWKVIEHNESLDSTEEQQTIDPPEFHIGRTDKQGHLMKVLPRGGLSALPWERGDLPELAFKKMVDAIWEPARGNPNPKLDRVFDYYLRMIWQLSLAVPLPYLEGHVFDMPLEGGAQAFLLSNKPKGAAERISIPVGGSIRSGIGLQDPVEKTGKFDVYIDELKLARPLKFKNLPVSQNALKHSLIFVGKCREEFQKLPTELSGGPLEFEAYLFWNPKIAPVEHQGSLIRIHGSSGTLFDPTFMRYQISELTRLRQITCEIFVREGLDSALNIDRESFNNAHPHSVYITRWLHGALRQLASTQKRIASEIREYVRDESIDIAVSEIQRVAIGAWRGESGETGSDPPSIELSSLEERPKPGSDGYVFSRSRIVPERTQVRTAKVKARDNILEEKLKAIAQVLASFGLLDSVPKNKQEKLLQAIFQILSAPEE